MPDAERLAILGVRACDLAALAVQDRDLPARPLPRPVLRRAPRAAVPGGGRLHALRRDLLLRVDGHRARAARGLRPRADRARRRLRACAPGARRGARSSARSLLPEAPPAALARERSGLRGLRQRDAALAPPRARCASCSTRTSSTRAGTRWRRAASRAATARWSAPPASATTCATSPPSISRARSACASGTRASTASTPRCTASTSARTSATAIASGWSTSWPRWVDQFDTSGCVGCGRCITWCPVGIDLTEEVAAIAATGGGPRRRRGRGPSGAAVSGAARRRARCCRSRRRSSRCAPSAATCTPIGCASSTPRRGPASTSSPGSSTWSTCPASGRWRSRSPRIPTTRISSTRSASWDASTRVIERLRPRRRAGPARPLRQRLAVAARRASRTSWS